MSKKNNTKTTGKTKGTTIKADAPAPVISNPGVELTTAWRAIHSGLVAVRGVTRTAEVIEAAVPTFLVGNAIVAAPSDGTPMTGRNTGLRIMEFQDRLYGANQMTGWGFTDAELAVAWRAEFPNAKCNFAVRHAYLGSARGDLNRGKRGMTVEQLRAQYKFDGPSTQFHAKVAAAATA